jgi:3-deoxy-D-manno-octulosonic-acid transferase
MILIYNIIALLSTPFFALWLLAYLIVNPEKRTIIPQRLGFGLKLPPNRKENTLWIHALSVGEISSATLLVKKLFQLKGESTTIVFSTTTVSGHHLAEQQVAPYCDALIYYPFDFLPVVKFFQRKIQPDLFIQIETDFWPNLLSCLARAGIPLLLFNGRISDRSMQRYQRFSFFFAPIFNTFTVLCMQTDSDARKMARLGVAQEKIRTLGNLKFGSEDSDEQAISRAESPFPVDKLCVLAGSTHAGEESLVLDAFAQLLKSTDSNLHLVLAPRNVSRSDEVSKLIEERDLSFKQFSIAEPLDAEVTIIDTIGDLSTLYHYADLSFIGGSLVAEGGHNPLEAARAGTPLLFGPYMDDFSEISQQLQECGAALLVKNGADLYDSFALLIGNESRRKQMGAIALAFSAGHDHVIIDHLKLIDHFI